jgi:hypothetical protein
MYRALQILREERNNLQRQLSALDNAIAALSGTTVTVAKKIGGAVKSKLTSAASGPKKHGRVWTPAMRAAASKRAKARLAKTKKG